MMSLHLTQQIWARHQRFVSGLEEIEEKAARNSVLRFASLFAERKQLAETLPSQSCEVGSRLEVQCSFLVQKSVPFCR